LIHDVKLLVTRILGDANGPTKVADLADFDVRMACAGNGRGADRGKQHKSKGMFRAN
jgi:hypothetical protein